MDDITLKVTKEYWNNKFTNKKIEDIFIDDWLERYNDIINKCNTPVLDLGCGLGNNTISLIKKNKSVICCDLSEKSIEHIRRNFNVLDAKCLDMLRGLPFENSMFDLVVADLCLHYFKEKDTVFVIGEIKRILRKNGYLLFRVNSVRDYNYGAGEGEKVEENLYRTKDLRLKRFFDVEAVKYFFKDFNFEYLKEEELMRIGEKKMVITGVAKK